MADVIDSQQTVTRPHAAWARHTEVFTTNQTSNARSYLRQRRLSNGDPHLKILLAILIPTMVDINDIPPEILATVFELGIYTSGISSLRSLSKVCRHWHDIIEHTPRLWGIILIRKQSSPHALERQISKAKAAPLSITVYSGVRGSKRTKKIFQQLVELSPNWVMVNAGTEFISPSRWVDIHHSLEELTLSRAGPGYDEPGPFFDGTDSIIRRETKLRSFTAIGLPRGWVNGFLGPSVRQFCLVRGYHDQVEPTAFHYRIYAKIKDTWHYLSRIPEAVSIQLKQLRHNDPKGFSPSVIHLSKLETLHIDAVLQLSSLLSSVVAPNLQTLSIDQREAEVGSFVFPDSAPMAPLFARWSEPIFLPANLHTLELRDCLRVSDVPYFIRWLARLPNLVRLFIGDDIDVLGRAPTQLSWDDTAGPTDFYKALAFPMARDDGELSWLCPSLMILHLDANQDIGDLLPIARARGGIAPLVDDIPPPNRLRRIEALLCNTGEDEEIEMLGSLVDQVYCICTNCGLHL